jgi:hypothetical protein
VTDFATLFAGFLGFFAGQVVFVGVMRWTVTIYELARAPADAPSQGKGLSIAMATIFGSGPWLLIATVGGAFFVRNEPYATPLFIGAAIAIVLMSSLGAWLWLRRVRAKDAKNAA